MQIRDPTHSQPGQVGHVNAQVTGDRDRQRTDRCGLVDDHQHAAAPRQSLEQVADLVLVCGSGLS